MKKFLIVLAAMTCIQFISGQASKVEVVTDADGMRLMVDGEDFMINGMNWDYIPIGYNTVDAQFWNNSDDVIKAGLDTEMSLLRNMGVNVIRQYTGVPARWIQYIYEKYGIYTMLNHSFGRYGLTLKGVWTPVTIYDDPVTEEFLMQEVKQLAAEYKDTPGLLFYLLGNENNYGLFWQGAETEDFPDDDEQKKYIGETRGRPMYRLMNEAAKAMKAIDPSRPVAMCNGDTLFIDIIAEECPDIDIYGTNTYRGVSFTDMFDVVKEKLDMALVFTEFGSDAYNAKENKEDQKMQAYYNLGNWKEIYQHAAGIGKTGISIGGFTFQFSDGWWKYGFDDRENADRHDNNASWTNGGYDWDLAPGQNNMNEEWFGICAKGPTNDRGLYELYPRASYYALKEAHKLNPYEEGMTSEFIENYFKNINLMEAVLKARGDKAALEAKGSKTLGISQLQAKFTSFNTGGALITTPDNPDPANPEALPNQLGFDHMQSFFIGVEANPAANLRAEVVMNVVGNVARNPIDEIFYESITRRVVVDDDTDEIVNQGDRVNLYQAEFEWNAKDFDIRAFYRTGHYHWQYEGDFFGLYPEANYGPNLDIYGGEILGAEIDGKGAIEGLKAAIGPQLWWGANPTMLFKYQKELGHFDIAAIYNRDFETGLQFDDSGRRVLDPNQTRSGIIPPWPTERATLAVNREFGKFDVTVGGIWGGNPLNGSSFQDIDDNGNVVEDKVQASDNWGGKAKITYEGGRFNVYAQGAIRGIVANGGFDATQTFTGWKLKDSGAGNVSNFLAGFTYSFDNFQIAPNFMWQKPLVAAMPNGVDAPGRLRNFIDDPFAVRDGNREMTAGEILFTFDPTPGTWFYQWDNDRSEDAEFAMNLGFVWKHLPTTMDAHIGFDANRQFFAFPNSAPARPIVGLSGGLWELHSRMVSKLGPDLGLIGNFFWGNGQANGDSQRLIHRYGGDIRAIYKKMKLETHVLVNDWGPFDYHRDFNLTFPLQLMLDISTSFGKPDWFILPNTTIGLRGTWRSLDQFSNRFAPTQIPPNTFPPIPNVVPIGFDNGQEWEIRTYIHINIGK